MIVTASIIGLTLVCIALIYEIVRLKRRLHKVNRYLELANSRIDRLEHNLGQMNWSLRNVRGAA